MNGSQRFGGNRGMKIWSSIGFAATIAVAFTSSLASAQQVIHACVASSGAVTIKATCNSRQAALTWNAAGTLSPNTKVQSIQLVDASNHVIATLGPAPNGGGALTFFDSNGKRLALVGVSDDGKGAGAYAFDGNTLASGNGIARADFGVGGPATPLSGFGMGVGGADGSPRLTVGSSLDGTAIPSNMALFDSSGKLRTGIEVFPPTNFVGFYSGVYTVTGGNPPTSSGFNESIMGNFLDNSASFADLFDSSGNLRTGIEYFPPTNFNGFFTQDGRSHTLSLLGSELTGSGFLAANDSSMQLLDATGQLRVLDFKNSTNEGGAAFSPTNVTDGGWGNP